MTLTTAQQQVYEKLTRKYMDADFLGIRPFLQGIVTTIGGVHYTQYVNEPTLFDYTEGTIPGGSGSTTLVPLTTITKGCLPVSALRHQAKAPDFTSDGNLLEWARAGANTMMRHGDHLALSTIIAAAPSNTVSLTATQENFLAASLDEQLDNMTKLGDVLATVRGDGYAPADIAIVMDTKGATRFTNGRSLLPSSFQNMFDVTGAHKTFDGSPIYEVTSFSTNATIGLASFGGTVSGQVVAVIIGKRAFTLKIDGPEVVNNMARRVDGARTLELEASYAYGISIASQLGTVKNA